MTEWTAAQERVMKLIYADGYRGPCGHPGPVMVVDASGRVRCCATLEQSCDHSGNPGDARYVPEAHTPACLERQCGTFFWPVSVFDLHG